MSVKIISTEQYFSMVRESLKAEGKARVRVTGGSMQPLLRHMKDSVIIERRENIRSGDIVLFARDNGRYALHRVISVSGNTFCMSGDNQRHTEKNLPCSSVIGVVSYICKENKTFCVNLLRFRIYSRFMVFKAKFLVFASETKRQIFGFLCINKNKRSR